MWSPQNPNRRGPGGAGLSAWGPLWGRLLAGVFLLVFAGLLQAQSRGQADIALQGYYLSGNSQPLVDTSGIAVRFQSIVPGLGLLSGSLEGYGSQSRLRTGENFLQLRGAPWLGQRWTFGAGDFRTSAAVVEFPFNNIFTPEITARGVKIEAAHEDRQYTFFAGRETLTAGPRVPFRILAPQTVIGASAVRKIGKHLAVGGRFLQLSSSAGDIAENPYLFPPGRELNLVRTFAAQSLYQPFKRLKLYAEASRSVAQGRRNLLSSLAGLVWDTEMLTLRANYSRQGALYLPLVGYFAGDRQGPFVEARFRPRKDLELYGSASQYRNNLEQDPQVTSIASASSAAGASVTLPGRFSLNGQLSTIQFSSRAFGEGAQTSHNRQVSATLARSIRRHSLHLTWRDMQLEQVAGPQRQRATEAEDMFQVRRMFLGGAVRWQQSSAGERRNSLYYRASAQGDAGRLRAFANIEIGNDLANRTIFATNTYSTTVVGVGLRLFRDWSLQTEVFRNRLNMDLNPESIFVLEGGGLPIGSNLAEFNQWSFFFRLTKQIRWGGGLPVEAADRIFARAAPLVGAVDGLVRIKALAGATPAAGIPVSLDGQRVATTSADGRYHFAEVPEGVHEVRLAVAQLPADFDPGEPVQARVMVHPRRMERADFEVLPLGSIEGKVTGPEGAALEGILIRLVPGDRYTTTAADGRFAFYNLHEGDFEVVLDPRSLPENAQLRSSAGLPVAIRAGTAVNPLQFSFSLTSQSKPVRNVLDKK